MMNKAKLTPTVDDNIAKKAREPGSKHPKVCENALIDMITV